MDSLKALPRVQKLYVAAGALAVFLVALLALKWFGPIKATDTNTWWIPLVLALVAGAYFVSEAFGLSLPVAGMTSSRALGAAFLVFFWTLIWFLEGADRGLGAWLGLISAVAATAGAWLVHTD